LIVKKSCWLNHRQHAARPQRNHRLVQEKIGKLIVSWSAVAFTVTLGFRLFLNSFRRRITRVAR
jgi:hypothetical protein